MSDAPVDCPHCGAPREAGLAQCRFCKTPFVENTNEQAIPCPQCQTLNEWGAQRCAICHAWVVVECVFCHALSPNQLPACLQCHEPFEGAPERLHARQHEAAMRQGLQVAATVATVAAPFLGALAGSLLGGRDDDR